VDVAAKRFGREGDCISAVAQYVSGAMHVQVLEERGNFKQSREAVGGGARGHALLPRVSVQRRRPALVHVQSHAAQVAVLAPVDILPARREAYSGGRQGGQGIVVFERKPSVKSVWQVGRCNRMLRRG
jgi:hypothetical protein